MFKQISQIYRKELGSFFRTRLAYFVIGIYVLISMLATFYMGYFFDLNNTELFSFFYFQADIFTILIPALTMRVWADEYKTGTIELILTQPIAYSSVVIGKFLAAWSICLLMLAATFPFWAYINSFIALDNLNIISAYLACALVCGSLCAVGCAVSAFNRNPILAYISTIFIFWLIISINFNFIINNLGLPNNLTIQLTQSLNFYHHYQNLLTGQLGLDNLIYYISIMILALWLNITTIEYKKN